MNIWALIGLIFGCIYLGIFVFSYVKIYQNLSETCVIGWKKITYPIICSLIYIIAVILLTPMLIVIFPFAFLQGLLSSINKKN